MKKYLLVLLILAAFATEIARAQEEDGSANVLSYYAAVNSLDGQPMIDMLNVLRFYPVFSMRADVDSVMVVVYRGPSVIRRRAIAMDDKRYWQVALPEFHLGEAIQRLEVEVHRKLGVGDTTALTTLVNEAYSKSEVDDIHEMRTPTIGWVNAVNITTSPIGAYDIIVDRATGTETIQYRNYKSTLRSMPALDPAERLGVFRPRYVPFAVIDGHIRGPFANGEHPAVGIFEIGFGFGDIAVPGDDFVAPEISIRRLGVAFVISEKLFQSDAEILALAFTYDINTYGSVGIGANFAPLDGVRKPSTYFSLGINRRAFEGVASQLQRLFR